MSKLNCSNESVKMDNHTTSILAQLFEKLPSDELTGQYEVSSQTWSHRDARVFSPVKNNQEM